MSLALLVALAVIGAVSNALALAAAVARATPDVLALLEDRRRRRIVRELRAEHERAELQRRLPRP